MNVKVTTRVFTVRVPTGRTEPTTVRSFVRDAAGTEHPVDTRIEVPGYEERVVEHPSTRVYDASEDAVRALLPPGTVFVATRDVVTTEVE